MAGSDKTCCCCISLYKGVLLMGYLQLASVILTLLGGAGKISEESDFNLSSHGEIKLFFGLLMLVLHLGLSLLLIIGVHKRKPSLLHMHHKIDMFSFYLSIVSTVLGLTVLVAMTSDFEYLILIVPCAVVLAIQWYYINVVHRACEAMELEQGATPSDETDNNYAYSGLHSRLII